MAYFPMFVEMKNKNCLVVGGGRVALRKVRMFLEFGAKIQVAAPDMIPELENLPDVIKKKRKFQFSDLQDMDLVIAATGSLEVNLEISEACKERGIYVNVVNAPEKGSFLCPAYLKQGEVVAAFSSGGASPVIPQYLKKESSHIVNEEIAWQAEYLGRVRSKVKQQIEEEKKRKTAYEQLFAFCRQHGRTPGEEEFDRILSEINPKPSNAIAPESEPSKTERTKECQGGNKNCASFFQNTECEYFPCHKGADRETFNCLFCYCPLYAMGKECGGNFSYTSKGIKDCTNCLVPHGIKSAEYIKKKFPELVEKMKQ